MSGNLNVGHKPSVDNQQATEPNNIREEGLPVVPVGISLETVQREIHAVDITKKEEGWGAWLFNNIAWAGAKMTESAYFAVVGFNPQSIRNQTFLNLEKIDMLSEDKQFSRLIELFLPKISDLAFNNIKSQGRLVDFVDFEEENIREIVKGSVVQLITNWAYFTKEKGGNTDNLMLDMFRTIINVGQKHLPLINEQINAAGSLKMIDADKRRVILEPFAKELTAMFLPNGRADIPAPYPINQWLYSTIQDMLLSQETLESLATFNTAEAEEALKGSPEGKSILDLLPNLRSRMKENDYAEMAPKKEDMYKFFNSRIKNDVRDKAGMVQWLGESYEKLVGSEAFNSLLKLGFAGMEAIVLKTSAEITTEKKFDEISTQLTQFVADHFTDLISLGALKGEAKQKRALEIFTPFSEKILDLLGWSDGRNLIVPGLMKPFLLPVLKAQLPQFIVQHYLQTGEKAVLEAVAWEREKESLSVALGEETTLAVKKFAKMTTDATFGILQNQNNPLLDAVILPKTKAGNKIAVGMDTYLEGVYMKVFYNLQAVIKQRESEDPEFNLKITTHLIKTLTDYIAAKNNGQLSTATPVTFQSIGESFLSELKINKDNLPVPFEFKETVWTMLTTQIIPNVFESIYKKFLNKEYLENLIVTQLKASEVVRQEGVTQKTSEVPETAVIEELNNQSTKLVKELADFLDIGLVKSLIKRGYGESIGQNIAQQIAKSMAQMPVSKIVSDGLKVASETNLDATIKLPPYNPEELPAVLGKAVRREARNAIKETIKFFQSVFDKNVKKLFGAEGLAIKRVLDTLFKVVGTVIWYVIAWIPSLIFMWILDRYLQRKSNEAVEKVRKQIDDDLATNLISELLSGLRQQQQAMPGLG